MSSFVGHSLAAISIYSLARKSHQPFCHRLLWLFWLIIIACAPDIDYFVPALNSSAHQNLRITHSVVASLVLPFCTILIFVIRGFRREMLLKYGFQAILAGLSHLILDLLVGVTPLPLMWPFVKETFRLPFGILPSAARLDISDYYFYRNIFIELGIFVPLLCSAYPIFHTYPVTRRRKLKIIFLLACSSCFVYWAHTMSR
ncbi:metal-dependent hydrolase [Desulfonema magnum]|uniref:Hydrolase domain-containing protein n=1 Tax=Desulfonema magnum TaxID=45655 RepID=A0A975BFQ7_9BACT|nr:metal-dependent hydrolase [Desulfonema magnum]QTA84455.1 Putative hydrolase domain-containing protein [Desulfonema magnum]